MKFATPPPLTNQKKKNYIFDRSKFRHPQKTGDFKLRPNSYQAENERLVFLLFIYH